MKLGRCPRVAATMGLLALTGALTVLPCLHTCPPPATAAASIQPTGDPARAGCPVCALGSTLRMAPAPEASPVAPSPEGTSVSGETDPAPVAKGPDASADPRAPPSRS
jgi:hypothetical protein